MTDREKLLIQLEGVGTGLDMAGYYVDAQCVREALAMLREQEPVEPHAERDCDDGVWYYGCGVCHGAIDHKDKFCRHCGREVKWNA